jgi:DNA invertase Pin-like site-specific DNA recombinase
MRRKRVAIYARVSTVDQSVEPQLLDLRRFVRERDWVVFREYSDQGVSGTKDSRPALDALMEDARKRRFDAVVVWRFDRFARSTRHLILALEEFRHIGLDFLSYQENVDTASPLGSAIFTIISAVAQLERDIIAERVKAGLRRARERGKRLGRPPVGVEPEEALRLKEQGFSTREIAGRLCISKTSVFRLLNGTVVPGPKTLRNPRPESP